MVEGKLANKAHEQRLVRLFLDYQIPFHIHEAITTQSMLLSVDLIVRRSKRRVDYSAEYTTVHVAYSQSWLEADRAVYRNTIHSSLSNNASNLSQLDTGYKIKCSPND